MNDPNNIDTKEEMTANIVKQILAFLRKHWWKLILVILSILIPLIFIDLSWLVGLIK